MTVAADLEALLAAVCADPADDAARLAFADLCDECGEADRAEFVRVQVELAKMPHAVRRPVPINPDCHDLTAMYRWEDGLKSPRGHYLCRRERELQPRQQLEGVFYALQQRFGGEGGSWRWRRGFVEHVTCACADWLARGPALVRRQPVTRVTLADVEPSRYDVGQSFAPEWAFFRGVRNEGERHNLHETLWDAVAADPRCDVHGRWADFPSAEIANRTLSYCAVAWARDAAGLPLLLLDTRTTIQGNTT